MSERAFRNSTGILFHGRNRARVRKAPRAPASMSRENNTAGSFRYCPKCGARALELCLPGMIQFGRVGSAYHRRDGVQSTPYGFGE